VTAEYVEAKQRLLAAVRDGSFREFAKNSPEEDRHLLQYEVIRWFHVVPEVYTGVHNFVRLLQAVYMKIGGETSCESVISRIAARLRGRPRLAHKILVAEQIIATNGPRWKDQDAFLKEVVREFLLEHNGPLVSRKSGKYLESIVLDRMVEGGPRVLDWSTD